MRVGTLAARDSKVMKPSDNSRGRYLPVPTSLSAEDTDAAGVGCHGGQQTLDCGAPLNAKVAAARAVNILMMKEKTGSCQVPTQSVYGVVVVMPQIARSAGWSSTFASLAIRGFLHLALNLVVQAVLLYQIFLESNVMNLYGGQPHLCNFGRTFDTCASKPGPDCLGPGGTTYTRDNLYGSFPQWSTRMYVRDALLLAMPEHADAIHANVVPGEYGIESPMCRVVCLFLFVMYIMDDLRETVNTALLLWHVPSTSESWLDYETPKWSGKDEAKKKLGLEEFDFIKFKIRGMSVPWKWANAIFVVLPKFLIWLLLISAGTQFLMDTAEITDLICNCLALAFVLQMDELIAARLCTEATKAIMDKLEAYDLYDRWQIDHENAQDNDVAQTYDRTEARWKVTEGKLLLLLFPKRLVAILVVCFTAYVWYFFRFCDLTESGAWVSKTLLPPARVEKLGTWLFWWIFAPSKIDRVETPSWQMPAGGA